MYKISIIWHNWFRIGSQGLDNHLPKSYMNVTTIVRKYLPFIKHITPHPLLSYRKGWGPPPLSAQVSMREIHICTNNTRCYVLYENLYIYNHVLMSNRKAKNTSSIFLIIKKYSNVRVRKRERSIKDY